MYLSDIRAAGGDINETAGYGLMIIFQDASPLVTQPQLSNRRCPYPGQSAARNLKETGKHPALSWLTGSIVGECDVGSTKFRGTTGERWTFTASGPSTNLAARLGGFARNGQILVSPETANVQSHFLLRCYPPLSSKTSANRWRSGKPKPRFDGLVAESHNRPFDIFSACERCPVVITQTFVACWLVKRRFFSSFLVHRSDVQKKNGLLKAFDGSVPAIAMAHPSRFFCRRLRDFSH